MAPTTLRFKTGDGASTVSETRSIIPETDNTGNTSTHYPTTPRGNNLSSGPSQFQASPYPASVDYPSTSNRSTSTTYLASPIVTPSYSVSNQQYTPTANTPNALFVPLITKNQAGFNLPKTPYMKLKGDSSTEYEGILSPKKKQQLPSLIHQY